MNILTHRYGMYTEEDLLHVVVDSIFNIKDPEFDYTLEQLGVVNEDTIKIVKLCSGRYCVCVIYTPTVPSCSYCSLIGLCIVYTIYRIDVNLAWDVRIAPNTHRDEININQKINDKESVCAAFEKESLRRYLDRLVRQE